MKVVHVNTFANGGAGIASIRLHKQLLSMNISSQYVCYNIFADEIPNVTKLEFQKYSLLQKLAYKFNFPIASEQKREYYTRKYHIDAESFSTPFSEFEIENLQVIQDADIIHLHWVSNFIDYERFFQKIKKPVVWTFHDMNPFLGSFHYQLDVDRNTQIAFLSEKYEKIKKNAIDHFTLPLNIITPSNWMKLKTQESRVFKSKNILTIPNGISLNEYKYIEKDEARFKLGLPKDQFILLTMSENIETKRKGFNTILRWTKSENFNLETEIFAIGENLINEKINNIHFTGKIYETSVLNLMYSAADFVLMPSLEDNLPNVIAESLMSGTPVIVNNKGGMPEMIQPFENGFIINNFDFQELNNILNSYKKGEIKFNRKSIALRSAEKYDIISVAQKHVQLYKTMIN